ncbi:hypothetical protein BDV98DRAFT_416172 [Pterulicium gracile]|uniref:Rhodopsin domain-containing protein n=1 Tax=Pterulicium gracile TaxID=1884261 RepID=A0A5C3QMS3_9AGAR|nr:hypothetical protein BDV98DRAFT_416172 [Pterula gracilis]
MLVLTRSLDRDASEEGIRPQVILSGIIGMPIAGAATLIRLLLRRHRLWWDDLLAGLSALSLLMTGVSGKLLYSINEDSTIPQSSRVGLYYIVAVTFDTTIWLSRLSLLLNIMRLGHFRRRLSMAAVLFSIALIILVAQIFWVCIPQDNHNQWKSDTVPQCTLGKQVAINQITTDFFADVVLVATPLLLLKSMLIKSKHSRALWTRLAASFSVAGLTTIVSIAHTVYLLEGSPVSLIVSNVQMSVSVVICNFLVLSAALHKLWAKYYPSTKESSQEPTLSFRAAERPPALPQDTMTSMMTTFECRTEDSQGLAVESPDKPDTQRKDLEIV